MSGDTAQRFAEVPGQKLDGVHLAHLEDMLEASRAGRVTAYVLIAKENGFTRAWGWQAITREDRVNILGQLEMLKAEIIHAEDGS